MNYLIEPTHNQAGLDAAYKVAQQQRRAIRKSLSKLLFLNVLMLVVTSLPLVLLAGSLFVAGYYFDSNPWFTLFPVGLLLMTLGGGKK